MSQFLDEETRQQLEADRAKATAQLAIGIDLEPDREVACMICEKRCKAPGFIVAAIRYWNHAEKRAAERTKNDPFPYVPQWIMLNQIVVCDDPDCAAEMRAQITAQSEADWRAMRKAADERRAAAKATAEEKRKARAPRQTRASFADA